MSWTYPPWVDDEDDSGPEWCGECHGELANGRCWYCDSAWIWTPMEPFEGQPVVTQHTTGDLL